MRELGTPAASQALLLYASPRALRDRDAAVPGETLVRAADALAPGLAARVKDTRVHRQPAAVPRFDVGHYRLAERPPREQSGRFGERRGLYCGGHLAGPDAERGVHPAGATSLLYTPDPAHE